MPYLIDGHNLIPKVGLSLRSLDDETELLVILQEFCRLKGRKVEVYFDGAPPGQTSRRKFGSVTAHFVRQGQTADSAIAARLRRMGRDARNWTVISSDHAVQAEARAAHATSLSSEDFANQLKLDTSDRPSGSERQRDLGAEEVDEWLELFRRRGRRIG
jgi:predicted RNA-binding protein with PIN domain